MLVWHVRIAADSNAEIECVRSLDPTSVNWSNVCDYM